VCNNSQVYPDFDQPIKFMIGFIYEKPPGKPTTLVVG